MGNEWTHSLVRRAPLGILCAFMRESWDKPVICKSSDWRPEVDLNGLYWKLTGIGKEELDAMNPEQRSKIEHPDALPTYWGMASDYAGLFGVRININSPQPQ